MPIDGKRVLFISYNGMLDPLGQSQVIPYLRELSGRGVSFTLLSFERAAAWQGEGRARCEELSKHLAAHNIEWHWLRYHQRPSLPATSYDVVSGIRRAASLIRRNRIEMIHARCGIPTTIALALRKRFGIKLISDLRGLIADEYAEAGHWRSGSIVYRLFKSFERRALAASDGVVTLTEAIWPVINQWDGLRGRSVAHAVVPCCADLVRYSFDPVARQSRRQELNLEEKLVVAYCGSIGNWYLTDQMSDFFVTLLKERPNAHFLWMTTGRHEGIDKLMQERGIAQTQYTVRAVAPQDVPSYLSASDIGIAFYKRGFSKLATSPVKIAEYLACGLPVVISAGIGDSDAAVTGHNVGALVADFTVEHYATAATSILNLLENVEGIRRRTRAVAEELFDLRRIGGSRYAKLYDEVCGKAPIKRRS